MCDELTRMVLYRKYRPQKIAEIDSSFVRQKLEVVLSSGNVPHALLFTGPRGTGKTSAARIIAKSLNCEKNNGQGEPCGECSSCTSITKGINLDVIEIDAASNRGIDEMRDLREKIRLTPSLARKKVYIIDEVHMLTTEAANALLKTLEEPPSHVVFILCTTMAEKLPQTVVSRCHRIEFRRANVSELTNSLKRVQAGERAVVEEKAFLEIALLSDGSYRDAHKLLEQVLATYPGEKIDSQMVKKVLASEELSGETFDWVETRDAKKGLLMINNMAEKGVDFKFLTQSILETLHAELLKRFEVIKENFSYDEHLSGLNLQELQKLISLFSKVSQDLGTAIILQLPLELAIVEWCENLDDGSKMIDDGNKKMGGEEFSPKPTIHHPLSANQLQDDLEKKWEELIPAVAPHNHSVAGLLRSCRPVSFDSQELVIEAFYKFHFDRLSENKVRALLEKVAGEVFGQKIKIFSRLKEKKNDIQE